MQKKPINFANLKHKINIFLLVRLDVLSPLVSDHFSRVVAGGRSACCGK